MNAVAWNQIDISDDTEEVVISSIAPSTIQLYRRMLPLKIWVGWVHVEQ